jgi:hypothetical protein
MPGEIMKAEIERPVGHRYLAQRPLCHVAEIPARLNTAKTVEDLWDEAGDTSTNL